MLSMKIPVQELIIGLAIYIISIYIHELGHYIVASYYGKFIHIDLSLAPSVTYYTEDKEEERQILYYGIIFGFIVISGYSMYLKKNYGMKGLMLAVVFIINYLNGCVHDIDRLTSM
jgi:hypothetical protein